MLTAPGAVAEIDVAEQSYFAAVSAEDPPVTAQILYTRLQYPTRLKSQLRENLKRHNIHVTEQFEVTPSQLEKVYDSAASQVRTLAADVDYDRGRDQISALLTRAVKDAASDIHIVRRRRAATVSFRINGQIAPHSEWSEREADQSCRFIYESMCQDQEVTWNPYEPQDAVMDTTLPDGSAGASAGRHNPSFAGRVRHGASDHAGSRRHTASEPAGIRFVADRRYPKHGAPSLGTGGHGPAVSAAAKAPRWSECCTRKWECIRAGCASSPSKILRSESSPGATQVPVVRRRGRSDEDEFAFAIRGALRCDPDTLMVGEIRDLQSAQLTIKFRPVRAPRLYHRACCHRHRYCGTPEPSRRQRQNAVHAGCAQGSDLSDAGAASVPALQDQHRGSTLQDRVAAAHRKRQVERARQAFEARGYDMDQAAWRPRQGCRHCNHTGVSGRVLMAEIVAPDEAMLLRLSDGDHAAATRYWLRHLDGRPAHEQGLAPGGRSIYHQLPWNGRLALWTRCP